MVLSKVMVAMAVMVLMALKMAQASVCMTVVTAAAEVLVDASSYALNQEVFPAAAVARGWDTIGTPVAPCNQDFQVGNRF